ncbi:hypothetical protein M422DRAFT_258030 [Sphaerobolus stellatus SS14]|uniref:Major facilitator superfamily (MFS) profile domain-containing protein n=1 Tax=Sphaerobolus stellatus (strain SS14) TaxID=990650 RepID=A0A0C9U801_SPHS4|nr:hypothetical protein M422DRAFT_258030 [Sphaerobolus stellatus SS14]
MKPSSDTSTSTVPTLPDPKFKDNDKNSHTQRSSVIPTSVENNAPGISSEIECCLIFILRRCESSFYFILAEEEANEMEMYRLLANFGDGYDAEFTRQHDKYVTSPTVLGTILIDIDRLQLSLPDGLQSLLQWESACYYPKGSEFGPIATVQNVGRCAVLPFVPYFCDGLGRRTTFFLGAGVILAGAVVQAFSRDVETFLGSRVMIGCGSAFTINAAIMLVTETAYPTQSATATAMFSALWQGGALVFSRLDYIRDVPHPNSWAWRIPSIVQAVAPLILMVSTVFGPESPRWLVSKGRESPIVRFQYRQIQTAIKQDKAIEWKDLIRTRGNRRRMMVIVALAFFSQWSGNGLVAYYLNQVFHIIGITDSFTQLLVNGFLRAENFLISLSGAFLSDRVGRRPLFIISTLGMLVTFTAQTGLTARYAESHGKGVAHAVLGFIFIFYAAYDGAYSTLYVMYTVEILPYAIRAKDLSVFYFVICVTSIANLQICNPYRVRKPQFLNPLRIQIKQRTLKETAGIFDGEKKLYFLRQSENICGRGTHIDA